MTGAGGSAASACLVLTAHGGIGACQHPPPIGSCARSLAGYLFCHFAPRVSSSASSGTLSGAPQLRSRDELTKKARTQARTALHVSGCYVPCIHESDRRGPAREGRSVGSANHGGGQPGHESLRGIFRRLIMALHPDLAQESHEQQRRHAA